MLKILEDESAVRKYRRQFIRSFKPFVDENIHVHLGHPGGAFRAKVLWLDRLGIWIFHEKISGNRCGHAFGVGKPAGTSSVSIICEINFPLQGIDRRMGGTLAEDSHGRVFVVHRGKIGGGKKGVGKSLFEKHYRGAWAVMEDGDVVSTVALVGVLNSSRFVRQVAQFIRKVDAMKDVISQRSSQTEISFDEPRFREELVGTAYNPSERYPDPDCDHGLVVSDLYTALKRKGCRIGNDAVFDLFVADAKSQVATVFQVMTDHSETVLHTGISKLLLNSTDLPGPPSLVLAVPAGIDQSLARKLKKIGIDALEYQWQEDRAVFPRLHDVINIR